MSMKERIQNDLKIALRENDEVRKRTLRMALSAIRFFEVEKGIELDDSAVISILQKEVINPAMKRSLMPSGQIVLTSFKQASRNWRFWKAISQRH